MIGLAGRPPCAFAVSAMCSCCSPASDLGVHMDTQTRSFTGWGGDPSMSFSREGHRLIDKRRASPRPDTDRGESLSLSDACPHC
jgi:hypothetical protein